MRGEDWMEDRVGHGERDLPRSLAPKWSRQSPHDDERKPKRNRPDSSG